jgi:hypothetical protein
MKLFKELKKLGFFEWLETVHDLVDTDMTPEILEELPLKDIHRTVANAMAFRFIREKYSLHAWMVPTIFGQYWIQYNTEQKYGNKYDSHEEAEVAALKKLCELISLDQTIQTILKDPK